MKPEGHVQFTSLLTGRRSWLHVPTDLEDRERDERDDVEAEPAE